MADLNNTGLSDNTFNPDYPEEQFKRRALSNNTFNLEAVVDSINQIQMSSFRYLHQVQIDMTEYKRFDFKMQDAQRSNTINHIFSLVPRRWVLYVPCDFIHEGKRLSYRRSKFYEKEIGYDDTLNNRDVFHSTFLVFIDGKLYFEGANILCKEDKTYCVFNIKEKPADKGIPKADFDKMMEDNVSVTIFFIPNYRNQNISTNAYALRDSNNNNGISYSKFEYTPDVNAICFATNNYSSIATLMTTELGENGLYLTNEESIQEVINESPKDASMYLNFLEFKYLHEVIEIGTEESDSWFELEIQDYPIAVDNCIIFDEDGNFMHDLIIDMYYPNIYHIIGDRKNKKLKVYVFYYKSNMLLKHRNALAVFYKYTKDVLDHYKQGCIPDIIKNYNPVKIEYDIKDFHKSEYYKDDKKNNVYYNDHFKYKVTKMAELTKIDAEYFRDYLINLGLKNKYYYLDLSTITNLKKKIRNDNRDTGEEFVKFDVPMYMFVFRNDFSSMYDEISVVLDGIRYASDYIYKTDQYDFVYIPITEVKNDSVIEIEKMKEVIREIPFVATKADNDTGRTSIIFDEEVIKHGALMNDMFIIDPETKRYLKHDEYEIYARVGDDMVNVVPEDLFLVVPEHVEINILNEELLGKTLEFHIKKNYRYSKLYTYKGRDNLRISKIHLDTINDPRHIRIYRNGRLVPRHIFTCRFPDHYYVDEVQLFPGMIREDGDVILVESMPYKMSQVCYFEKLEKNKIIDLTGKLDKPFDLRWHDVFLNGRKLHKNDIEIISSNKIVIRETESLQWLEIIENFRDDEYFGYMPLNDIIDGILDSEDDDGFRKRIEDTIDDMKDREESVVTQIVTIVEVIMNMFYWDYMVPYYGLINPDIKQISQETHDFYIDIMDGDPFLLNGDYGRNPVYNQLHVNADYDADALLYLSNEDNEIE